ncbi:MAG TPA: FAD-binding oxidoreductase [Thermodesulfobacteriota bacterium]|nr:FAD-binding oxidoreductase [Thermodesulfobacteriota bacterium]
MAKTLSEIAVPQNTDDTSSQTILYSVDGAVPKLVLFPGTIEEASQLLTLSYQEKESVIPWGNGTKMGWGNPPSQVDWVVCTKRLDRITDCDHENLTVGVEAGIPLSKVQERLRGLGRGYFIPLDPPFTETATIGGIAATNASGPKRHLYGTARDIILGMSVVLPNGDRNNWGGKTVKNVAGYDMSKLYIGSFGTLGIITEVTFRILPLPERETTFVAVFSEIPSPFKTVSGILQSELLPSAIEILNSRVLEALGLELFEEGRGIPLAVNFEGFDESVERQIRQVKEMVRSFHPLSIHFLEGALQEQFWKGLRNFELTVQPHFPDRISCKITVPVSKAGDVFRFWKEMADEEGLHLCLRSHAGSGIVYADLLLKDLNLGIDELVKALNETRKKVEALDGDMVIKGAPSPLKKRIDAWGRPGRDFSIMQNVKSIFDPHRLLNPGRFVGGI